MDSDLEVLMVNRIRHLALLKNLRTRGSQARIRPIQDTNRLNRSARLCPKFRHGEQREIISDGELTECFLWVCLIPLSIVLPETIPAMAVSASIRLISLGREGATAIFFAGQPVVSVFAAVCEVNLPEIAITATLSAAVLASLRRHSSWNAARLFVSIVPFLAVVYSSNQDLSNVLKARFVMMAFQAFAASLLIASLVQSSLMPGRLIIAVSVTTVFAGILYFMFVPTLFTRSADLPVIDIARCGFFAAIVICGYLCANTITPRTKWLGALACVVILIGMQTVTRQAIGAAVCALVAPALVKTIVPGTRMRLAAVGILLVLAVALLWLVIPRQKFPPSEASLSRLGTLHSGGRDQGYAVALEMFLERPILGHGFGGFGERFNYPDFYPHNVILEVLAEFGGLGLLLFLLPWILARLRAVTNVLPDTEHARRYYYVFSAIIVYWCLISMVSYSLPHSIFCVFGLAWFAETREKSRRPHTRLPESSVNHAVSLRSR